MSDEAIVEFRKALETYPRITADARHQPPAVILLQKGQMDAAIAQFQMIREQYLDDAMASFDLGNAYFQKGQMDEAVASYSKSFENQASLFPPLTTLVYSLSEKGHLQGC